MTKQILLNLQEYIDYFGSINKGTIIYNHPSKKPTQKGYILDKDITKDDGNVHLRLKHETQDKYSNYSKSGLPLNCHWVAVTINIERL